jgi:hypothetical protein
VCTGDSVSERNDPIVQAAACGWRTEAFCILMGCCLLLTAGSSAAAVKSFQAGEGCERGGASLTRTVAGLQRVWWTTFKVLDRTTKNIYHVVAV